MKLFISLGTSNTEARNEALSYLQSIKRSLLQLADPSYHKYEYRDRAIPYQKLLDELGDFVTTAKSAPNLLNYLLSLRKLITTGIERNSLDRAIDCLKTPDYNRLRWLWANHNKTLNAWEKDFVTTVGKQLAASRNLSLKQKNTIQKLFSKYKVPYDATASCSF